MNNGMGMGMSPNTQNTTLCKRDKSTYIQHILVNIVGHQGMNMDRFGMMQTQNAQNTTSCKRDKSTCIQIIRNIVGHQGMNNGMGMGMSPNTQNTTLCKRDKSTYIQIISKYSWTPRNEQRNGNGNDASTKCTKHNTM